MNDTHNLLAIVLKQHYVDRPGVISAAREIIKNYINHNSPTYEETLGQLYQLMRDLPPDILLFFLTTVPLPTQIQENPSYLVSRMKHMMSPMFQKNVKPIIQQYLKDHVPRLVPISNKNSTNAQTHVINLQPNEPVSSTSKENAELKQDRYVKNVKSVIDENIQLNKMLKKKGSKAKNKFKKPQKKSVPIKSLAIMCAENIYKSHLFYKSFYNKQKQCALKLVDENKCDEKSQSQCHDVLRDVNKKIEWLKMFETGIVPLRVMEEEYGNSDILYLERQHQHSIPDDVLGITPELSKSIDTFLNNIDIEK